MDIISFRKFLIKHIPTIFDEGIATDEKLNESIDWYVSHIEDVRTSNVPVYFYDWVTLAIGGCEKARAFLSFCQELFVRLLRPQGSIISNSIKQKIRQSIFTRTINPSYMDSLGELCLITHLVDNSQQDNYKYLGTEFDIGNGKSDVFGCLLALGFICRI